MHFDSLESIHIMNCLSFPASWIRCLKTWTDLTHLALASKYSSELTGNSLGMAIANLQYLEFLDLGRLRLVNDADSLPGHLLTLHSLKTVHLNDQCSDWVCLSSLSSLQLLIVYDNTIASHIGRLLYTPRRTLGQKMIFLESLDKKVALFKHAVVELGGHGTFIAAAAGVGYSFEVNHMILNKALNPTYDPIYVGSSGKPPLIGAADDIVEVLIGAGASVDSYYSDDAGLSSSLISCIQLSRAASFAKLLNAGASTSRILPRAIFECMSYRETAKSLDFENPDRSMLPLLLGRPETKPLLADREAAFALLRKCSQAPDPRFFSLSMLVRAIPEEFLEDAFSWRGPEGAGDANLNLMFSNFKKKDEGSMLRGLAQDYAKKMRLSEFSSDGTSPLWHMLNNINYASLASFREILDLCPLTRESNRCSTSRTSCLTHIAKHGFFDSIRSLFSEVSKDFPIEDFCVDPVPVAYQLFWKFPQSYVLQLIQDPRFNLSCGSKTGFTPLRGALMRGANSDRVEIIKAILDRGVSHRISPSIVKMATAEERALLAAFQEAKAAASNTQAN